eukprot:TRINITY_DN25238_c0_g1_i1.p1 TRINITY_DN25238_c0_g1~~TRINITY_DN25238_c0_g1_i1.p1  ORF type:complete len:126 (+),score=25.10 TRINITY_DN25238_c0_g1_i1:96-473(+)
MEPEFEEIMRINQRTKKEKLKHILGEITDEQSKRIKNQNELFHYQSIVTSEQKMVCDEQENLAERRNHFINGRQKELSLLQNSLYDKQESISKDIKAVQIDISHAQRRMLQLGEEIQEMQHNTTK